MLVCYRLIFDAKIVRHPVVCVILYIETYMNVYIYKKKKNVECQ